MRARGLLLVAVSLGWALPAQAAPNLSDQGSWTESDKREFLKFLETGRGAPVTGQVRQVSTPPEETEGWRSSRKPYYLAVEGIGGLTVAKSSALSQDSTATFLPRFLFGGHVYSWIRYFVGIERDSIGESLNDGTKADVGNLAIPMGLELALIPLGSPHTQYFILRAGVATHFFSSGHDESEFTHPLLGMHESWNLGLGYEWQIANSRLRLHAIGETEIAFGGTDSRFYSFGVGAGVAWTF